jgi:glucokinase-like ROK family protein
MTAKKSESTKINDSKGQEYMSNPGNSKYVKKLNRMRVVNIIKDYEPISRQQIAEQTGLTPPAITGIIRELIDMNFVKEIGLGESHGGRKPVKLKFNCKAGYVLGIEMTHHETVFAIADLKNRPNTVYSVPIDMGPPQIGVPLLVAEIRQLINQEKYNKMNFMAVGIAFPGMLHVNEGIVKRAINLGPEWNEYPLQEVLEAELGVPVVIENNAKAAALAEKWFGDGTKYENLAYINMGEGISTGILVDGSILQGAYGYAGQIGHMVVDKNGPLCNCGNRGCLEAVCACPALIRKVRAELPQIDKADPIVNIYNEKGIICFSDIVLAAAVDGSYAQAMFREVGKNIGLVLVNMINLYNPEAIFIGGKMAVAGNLFIDVVKEIVNTRALPEVASSTVIGISSLGIDTGSIGACALVLNQLLHSTTSSILDDNKPLADKRENTVFWNRYQIS